MNKVDQLEREVEELKRQVALLMQQRDFLGFEEVINHPVTFNAPVIFTEGTTGV